MIELAKDLRLAPVHVMGHLHALWHAALEQQEDGNLSSWSDELIAEMSCYPGDVSQYVQLLQKHEWLDGKLLHDWLDYAGKYLTAKYRTSNPKKLRQILFKHKSVNSRSKVGRSPIGLGRLSGLVLKTEGESEGKPLWLDSELWEKFRQHRKKMGKPLSTYAEERAIAKLSRLRDAGEDPKAVIEQSIDMPWLGLFAVGNKPPGRPTGKDIFSKLSEPLPE